MISYNPKDARQILEPGDYLAELKAVTETVSKAGNDMWVLEWRVPFGGKDFAVKDFIVNPQALWKLEEVARAFGAAAEFDSGDYQPQSSVGQVLTVGLAIRKDATGKYSDQNQVAKYKPAEGSSVERLPPPADAAPAEDDEDIPF